MFDTTIAAISTALAPGAISIVRVSGEDAISIVQSIFNKDITKAKSYTMHYGYIIDENKQPVDEVLVSIFRAPKHIRVKTLSKSIATVVCTSHEKY